MEAHLESFVHTRVHRLKRRRVSQALDECTHYTAYDIFVPDADLDQSAIALNLVCTWREVLDFLYTSPRLYSRDGITAVMCMRGNYVRIVVTACRYSSCF